MARREVGARGERGLPLLPECGKQRDPGGNGNNGFSQSDAPRFFEDQDEIPFVETQASEFFGNKQTGYADLGEARPEFIRASCVRLPKRPDALRRALGLQEVAHGLAKQGLILTETEFHCLLLRLFPG